MISQAQQEMESLSDVDLERLIDDSRSQLIGCFTTGSHVMAISEGGFLRSLLVEQIRRETNVLLSPW